MRWSAFPRGATAFPYRLAVAVRLRPHDFPCSSRRAIRRQHSRYRRRVYATKITKNHLVFLSLIFSLFRNTHIVIFLRREDALRSVKSISHRLFSSCSSVERFSRLPLFRSDVLSPCVGGSPCDTCGVSDSAPFQHNAKIYFRKYRDRRSPFPVQLSVPAAPVVVAPGGEQPIKITPIICRRREFTYTVSSSSSSHHNEYIITVVIVRHVHTPGKDVKWFVPEMLTAGCKLTPCYNAVSINTVDVLMSTFVLLLLLIKRPKQSHSVELFEFRTNNNYFRTYVFARVFETNRSPSSAPSPRLILKLFVLFIFRRH